MAKMAETKKFIKELKQAGFTVTKQPNNHYRVIPPLPFRGQQGALYFIACSPGDPRAMKNQRAWAEKFGLPKKIHRN